MDIEGGGVERGKPIQGILKTPGLVILRSRTYMSLERQSKGGENACQKKASVRSKKQAVDGDGGMESKKNLKSGTTAAENGKEKGTKTKG